MAALLWGEAGAQPTRALTPIPASPAPTAAALPPNAPFLRIAAEFHTQVVNGLALDPSGRIAATVSDDKTLRIRQAIRGSAGGNGRLMDQSKIHRHCACSRQAVKSAAVAPAAK